MGAYLYGIFYTILYVLLCRMFIETFEERRKLPGKIYEYGSLACLTVLDFAVSAVFHSNIVTKEICIVALGTFFMWICFKQKCMKILIFILLYQGICFVIDYISIIIMSKCFPVITIERIDEPLVNSILGILSQMLLACFIMLLRR